VFHIDILYAPLNQKKHSLDHGKTIIREVTYSDPMHIRLGDTNLKTFDACNVFPECFIISVPLFDDVIKEEIDEWLYLMKYFRVKEDFKSPYMKI
jgi:hypothetical protein